MQDHLSAIDERIPMEANELIYGKNLHQILTRFGTPHYTGSYALHLMTWRDLDIYLEANNLSKEIFFELGKNVDEILSPVKMSFRNERIAQTPELPRGLYWGIYLGDERKGAWKIDIWTMDTTECLERIEYCRKLSEKISDPSRSYILEIKSQCWKDPAYRKVYSSTDIYQAVIENAVTDIEGFRKWLVTTNKTC